MGVMPEAVTIQAAAKKKNRGRRIIGAAVLVQHTGWDRLFAYWAVMNAYSRILLRSLITDATLRSFELAKAWVAFTPRSLASNTVTSALALIP
jgi:hypothetical protein